MSRQAVRITDWLIPSPAPNPSREAPGSAPIHSKKAPKQALATSTSSSKLNKRKRRSRKTPAFPQPDFGSPSNKADHSLIYPTPTKPTKPSWNLGTPQQPTPTLLKKTPSSIQSCVQLQAKKTSRFDSSPVLKKHAGSFSASGGGHKTPYQPRPETGNGTSYSCPEQERKLDGSAL